MKKHFLLYALVFSLSVSAQLRFDYPTKEIEPAQLIVTYSLKFQEDSLNPEYIRQEDMFLFIGEKTSKFISKNYFKFDTLKRKIKSFSEYELMISGPNKQTSGTAFQHQSFKNYPKGRLTCIEHIIDGTFKYEENMGLFNWQLTNETATLYGYKVQKAITEFGGRKWIAWFAPELPFSDGPYKFNGLPGLIVKLYDSRNHYVYEFISIQKPLMRTMLDYREKDFIVATKQDFFRAEDAFRVDIINRAKTAGLNNELQQRAARNLARKNNPIELKRK
jgi:GLPGLI family protein